MTDQAAVDWPTCDEDGCIGVRLAATAKCLAHARDQQRNATLKQLGESGEIDARGVPITQALLDQILAAAPHDAEDHPTFIASRFDRATLQDLAWFAGATFHGYTAFFGATLKGDAAFDGATFNGPARFDGATFQSVAGFDRATFKGPAWFSGATFKGLAWFHRATFLRDAGFGGVTFRHDPWFANVRFEQARQLGPLLVYGVLRLDGAHFAQLIQIEVSTRGLSCQRARFPAGVQFRLRGAQIVLDDADLSSPSILAGVGAPSEALLARRMRAVQRLAPQAAVELSARPRLLSVQGANVAGLTVSNVDLTQCRFAGAHNLDKLHFETEISFAVAPARLPWDWRQVLAEERLWRVARSNRWAARWTAPDWRPDWLHPPYGTRWPEVVEPAQVAGLYRALRKAREDAKDEPGAADFYYGEMEMRRHARRGGTGGASRGLVERAVLTAYWLVSGYGLRAWRALTALAVVLIAFAGLLVGGGYEDTAPSPDAQPVPATTGPISPSTATNAPASPATSVTDRSLVGALLYGARTIIGLNPTPAPALTRFGEVLLIAVRVLGPLLLGLALLALRGRVKR